jgi:hypothetical protein
MSNECAVGVFETIEHAKAAVHILDRAGFAADHISVVTRHIDTSSDVGKELNLSDDSLRDAAIGATLGGVLGVLGDAAIYLIAGVGAVVVSGPLVGAMAIVGAFLGAMEGWGIHRAQIRRYESLVQQGRALVIVDGNPDDIEKARRMLVESDALEVHHYATSSDEPMNRTRGPAQQPT